MNEMNEQRAIHCLKCYTDEAVCEECDFYTTCTHETQADMARLAIYALEKQIPKKPIFDGLYACPTCHTIMLQGAFEAKGKCCKECGQMLDWSDTV